MKINKISLFNFRSYDKANISFEDQDLIGIIGKYTNSPKSIGTGKSAFLESILFAIYGKSRDKDVADVVGPISNKTRVELEFNMNGPDIRINRTVEVKENNKTEMSISVDIFEDGK